ncbi:MAG: anti-sigma factor [Microscillaceae bacterium]|nr:anti-sigma factor [Microscillaceae bacterium]
MNLKNYLESGIIENYVLGAATPEEAQELERLSQQYPEIRREIEANQFALMEYILECRQEPPLELRDKVIKKLAALEEEDLLAAPVEAKPLTVAYKARWGSLKPLLAVAASLLLLVSMGLNLWLYQNWQKAESALRTSLLGNQQFAQQTSLQRQQLAQATQELSVLKNPATRLVSLEGVKEHPEAQVRVYWNPQTQEVYLQVKNLPEPPTGKQYQLWFVDGQKVMDGGVFEMGDFAAQLQKMKTAPRADAFVVTLEKAGGVPVSEGDTYAVGKVS